MKTAPFSVGASTWDARSHKSSLQVSLISPAGPPRASPYKHPITNDKWFLFHDDRYAIGDDGDFRVGNAFFRQDVFGHSQGVVDGGSVFHVHVFDHLLRGFSDHDDGEFQEHTHEDLGFPLVEDRFVAAAGQDFVHGFGWIRHSSGCCRNLRRHDRQSRTIRR